MHVRPINPPSVENMTRPTDSNAKRDRISNQFLDDPQSGPPCGRIALAGVTGQETGLNQKTSQPGGFSLISKAKGYRLIDRIFLASCFVVILFISAADTWLALMNRNILNAEMNLICAWLLRIDAETSACFVAGKTCGTVLVLLSLFGLLHVRYRHARIVLGSVALFQICLLTYLCLSDPKMDGWINFQALFDETEASIFWQAFNVNLEPK